MDRSIIYSQAQARSEDVLKAQQFSMIAVAKLSQDLFGTQTLISGLTVTPNSPAALNVLVAPGQIYSQEDLEATDYGVITADTTHTIIKQGILQDQLTLSCAAPTTSGYSIVYLIQAIYEDIDGTDVVLAYYNSADPANPLSGSANSGIAQPTIRQGACTINAKAGVAAPTGSQTAPSADVGYVGIAEVLVTYGDTGIATGAITLLTANSLPAGGILANYLTSVDAAATYLTQASAASTYLTQANAASTYLTQTNAASTYLTQANAASTYLTQTNAASTYLTQANAASTYLTQATALTTYLKQTDAAATYLTSSTAAATYLTQSNAASTYALKAGSTSVDFQTAGGTGANSAVRYGQIGPLATDISTPAAGDYIIEDTIQSLTATGATYYGAQALLGANVDINIAGTYRCYIIPTARTGNSTFNLYHSGSLIASVNDPTINTTYTYDITFAQGDTFYLEVQNGNSSDSGTYTWGLASNEYLFADVAASSITNPGYTGTFTVNTGANTATVINGVIVSVV